MKNNRIIYRKIIYDIMYWSRFCYCLKVAHNANFFHCSFSNATTFEQVFNNYYSIC